MIREKEIFVEYAGVTYKALMFIEGKRKLYLRVLFRGRMLADGPSYKPGQEGAMEATARQLVWEVLSGRTLYR